MYTDKFLQTFDRLKSRSQTAKQVVWHGQPNT